MMKIRKLFSVFIVLAFLSPVASHAAKSTEELPNIPWGFQKVFSTYDRPALQRGFQVYKEVCAGCHGLDKVAYRNLSGLGYNPDEIKAIAAEYTVIDGPNDEGEMFERAAVPADRFVSPFPNDNAARASNGGALPPDLSLIIKARTNGPNYLFGLLTGYAEEAPAGEELLDGQYWNKYFPGHKISMAPPLSDGLITYSDGTEATVEMATRDVVEFLAWASEPTMEARKQMGVKVLLFLFFLSVLLYIVKRRVWRDVH